METSQPDSYENGVCNTAVIKNWCVRWMNGAINAVANGDEVETF